MKQEIHISLSFKLSMTAETYSHKTASVYLDQKYEKNINHDYSSFLENITLLLRVKWEDWC